MNTPGCYGAASAFSHDSATCQGCPHFTPCAGLSLERLQAISGTINVTDLLKKHERAQAKARPERAQRHQSDETRDLRIVQRAAPIEPPQRKTQVEKVTFEINTETRQLIANITNKKAQAHALILCKGQDLQDLIDRFGAGENPMPASPKWLHQVGEELLAGKINRQNLKVNLAQQQQWGEATAGSHVSIAWSMFIGLGIAVEQEGSMLLSPRVGGHN